MLKPVEHRRQWRYYPILESELNYIVDMAFGAGFGGGVIAGISILLLAIWLEIVPGIGPPGLTIQDMVIGFSLAYVVFSPLAGWSAFQSYRKARKAMKRLETETRFTE